VAKEFTINFALLAKLNSSFSSAFGSAASKMSELNTNASALKAQMKQLDQNFNKGLLSVNEYARAQSNLASQMAKVEARQKSLSAAQKWQNRADSMRTGGRQMALQAFETGMVLGAPVKAAIDFETAMLGVAKQVDGARDDAGNLTDVYYKMESQVKALSKTIPLATNEIADMFAAGARMGVAKDELASFVQEAAKMATAFEMPAGEIAQSMGKIANVVGLPINRINELADTINYLDDNAMSQGKDIIGVLLRIGGTAKQTGLSFQQAAALGSTLLSLGKTEETAATASNAIMRELSIATMQPKRFQEGLAMIGMQAEAVQSGMATNAQETILQVLEAINKLDKEVQVEATTRLFGEQFGDEAALLAGSMDEYRRQLALVNDEKRKGSMDREFQARMKTTAAQLQIAKNAAMETGIAFGAVLLPGIVKLAQHLGRLAEKVTAFAAEYPRLTEVLSYGTAIILGTTAAFGALAYIGGIIASPFVQLWAWISKIGLMSKLAPILGLVTIKFVLIAAAIAAVVAAGVWLYNNWDMVKTKAVETWGAITQWVSGSIDAIGAWVAALPGKIAYAIGFLVGLWLSLPQRAWAALSALYSAVVEWLPQAYDAAITWLGSMATQAGSYFMNLPGAAIAGMMGLYDAVSTWAQNAYNAVVDWVMKIPDVIAEAFGRAAASVGSFFSNAAGKISAGFSAGSGGGGTNVASNALGGIYSKGAFLTTFAEQSDEAAIPLDGSARSVGLWQQAGQMMGLGGGGGNVYQITFAPTVNGGGNAGEISQVLKQERDAFMQQFEALARQERRLSYA
jgi:TP901 family phage tail tape measure protein